MEATPARYIKGYELKERIGAGSFGAVYRAYQSTIRREVAIKVILPHYANHPDFIRRFEAEAQIIAHLEHPHIAPLYDYWRDPDGAYLVMRLLKGGNLRDAINDSPLTLEVAAAMLDQLASALAFAHRNHVIHQDLKPSNILMDEDDNVYLADFGIARIMALPDATNSDTPKVLGSPDYISPEQARLEPVSPQSDIYSLGVVLYAALTGHVPFSGVSTVERVYRHLNEPIPQIDSLVFERLDDVNEVIQKATAKNPANRFPDVLTMAEAFRKTIASNGERDSVAAVVEQLTYREQEVLQHIIEGASNREIAQKLFVQVSTIKWYVNQIYRKLHVHSRVQAIVRARELNLVVDGASQRLAAKESAITVSNIPEPSNPYKGLRPFQSSDANDFFGRERVVTRLLNRLCTGNGQARFLAVVGPSGSGKSSLVKAGFIPALWRGELAGSERWYIIEMVPGAHPMDELEVALMRIAADQIENIRDHLDRDHRGLSRIAGLILPKGEGDLLLFVDQFEELFTLVEDETERMQFLKLLHHAVTTTRGRVRVIITMRADFYDRPLFYPDLGELVRSHLETVLPLSAEELEKAIMGPAERVGVTLEAGLVASIVSDVNYQPGALPMLQYTLTELFERRQGLLLTLSAYQAIGGAIGALAFRADEIYHELNPEGREMTRQIFLRLVTLGEGTEETRRRVPRSELLALADNEDLMDDIIDSYATYRLLSLDADPLTRSPVVELAHEAMLRDWERLRIWIDSYREDIRQQQRLARSAAEWRAADCEVSYLLRGGRLKQLEDWAFDTQLVLTESERDYLAKSLAERTRLADIEVARLDREKILAHRSRRSLQVLVMVLGVATVLSISLSLFAFDRERQARSARQDAERESTINRSLALAASAREESEVGRGDLALQLALVAANIEDPPNEVIRSLTEVALSPGTRMVLHGHRSAVRTVTFSPDGQSILSGGCAQPTSEGVECPKGELILWDITTGDIIHRWEGHASAINAAAIDPTPIDEETLVAISGAIDGTLIIWDLETGQQLRQLEGHTNAISDITVVPERHIMISAAFDGNAILWDVISGEMLQQLEGHSAGVNTVEISSDGNTAITASIDTTIIAWDIDPDSVTFGQALRRYEGHGSNVKSADFVGDGTTILSNSEDLSFRLWDYESGAEIRQRVIGADGGRLVISPDGHTVLFLLGRPVYLWDVEDWGQDRPLAGHSGDLLDVEFSPDGILAVTASMDGTARVWNIASPDEVYRYDVGMPTGTVDVSADGRLIAIAEGWSEGHLWIFETETGELVRMIPGPGLGVAPGAIAFHPNGRSVLVGAEDISNRSGAEKLILWDIETGEMMWDLEGHEIYLRSVAISPDGRYALSGSQALEDDAVIEGELMLWDLESGQLVRQFDTTQDTTCIEFNAAGDRAVTSSAFLSSATIWDIETGQALSVFPDQPGFVLSVVFGPDETTIITATHEGNIVEWDIDTGEEVRRFVGHDGPVWRLSMAPNKQMIAAGSADGSVILWDYESGQIIRQFTGHTGWVFDVMFNKDSSRLYSASADGSVREWMVSGWEYDDLLGWIDSNRYLRELSCEERVQYRLDPLCEDVLE